MELLMTLDDSAFSQWLRASFWVYPLINTVHVLGIGLLIGGILPLDARLLGLWPTVPVDALTRTVLPCALVGCGLALVSGPLLFAVQPLDYATKPIFWLKMSVVAAGVGNALLLRRSRSWRSLGPGWRGVPPTRLRWAGGLSLGLWLSALALGRLLAYV
jgi:hypothetical protein